MQIERRWLVSILALTLSGGGVLLSQSAGAPSQPKAGPTQDKATEAVSQSTGEKGSGGEAAETEKSEKSGTSADSAGSADSDKPQKSEHADETGQNAKANPKADEAKDKPKKLSDKQLQRVAEEEASTIVFHWQQLTNHASVSLSTGQVSRYLQLTGEMSLPHDTRVMGVTDDLYFTSAVNQKGRELLPNRADYLEKFNQGQLPPNADFDRPDQNSNDPAPNAHVNGYIRNIDVRPQRLKHLAGFVGIRVGAQTNAVEIPFEKTKKFKKLVPGLKYKVKQASDSSSYGRGYFYFYRTGQNPNQRVRMDHGPAVGRIELIDDTGKTLHSYSQSEGSTSTNVDGTSQRVYYMNPRFRIRNHGKPKKFRIQIAAQVVTKAVQFKFKDVPVP